MLKNIPELFWGPLGVWIGFSALLGLLIFANNKWKRDEEIFQSQGDTAHIAKQRLLADRPSSEKQVVGDIGKEARKVEGKVGMEKIPPQKDESTDASILPPTDMVFRKQPRRAPTNSTEINLGEERTEARVPPKILPEELLRPRPSGPETPPAPFREDTDPEVAIASPTTRQSTEEPTKDYGTKDSELSIPSDLPGLRCPSSALDLIKRFEGFAPRPYRCPADVYTIGYGSTVGVNGKRVSPDHPPIDKPLAERLLRRDLLKVERSLSRAIQVPTDPDQWGALCSFVFNVGSGQFGASTLLRKLNRGDYRGAADQFPRWVYAGQTRLGGLYTRRKLERALFLGFLN